MEIQAMLRAYRPASKNYHSIEVIYLLISDSLEPTIKVVSEEKIRRASNLVPIDKQIITNDEERKKYIKLFKHMPSMKGIRSTRQLLNIIKIDREVKKEEEIVNCIINKKKIKNEKKWKYTFSINEKRTTSNTNEDISYILINILKELKKRNESKKESKKRKRNDSFNSLLICLRTQKKKINLNFYKKEEEKEEIKSLKIFGIEIIHNNGIEKSRHIRWKIDLDLKIWLLLSKYNFQFRPNLFSNNQILELINLSKDSIQRFNYFCLKLIMNYPNSMGDLIDTEKPEEIIIIKEKKINNFWIFSKYTKQYINNHYNNLLKNALNITYIQ